MENRQLLSIRELILARIESLCVKLIKEQQVTDMIMLIGFNFIFMGSEANISGKMHVNIYTVNDLNNKQKDLLHTLYIFKFEFSFVW